MTKRTSSFITLVSLSVAAMLFFACSREETNVASGSVHDYQQIALEFTEALAAREYERAYAMISQEYHRRVTIDQLRAAFEAIVPTDWSVMDPVEVGETMTSWPGKQPSDLGWAYVSIGGDVYSEAVTVVVTSENEKPKIREVEFGRP